MLPAYWRGYVYYQKLKFIRILAPNEASVTIVLTFTAAAAIPADNAVSVRVVPAWAWCYESVLAHLDVSFVLLFRVPGGILVALYALESQH